MWEFFINKKMTGCRGQIFVDLMFFYLEIKKNKSMLSKWETTHLQGLEMIPQWLTSENRNRFQAVRWYLSIVVLGREIFEELLEDKCCKQKSEALCVFQFASISHHENLCKQTLSVFVNTFVHSCTFRLCPHSTSAALGGAQYALRAPLTLKSATSVE